MADPAWMSAQVRDALPIVALWETMAGNFELRGRNEWFRLYREGTVVPLDTFRAVDDARNVHYYTIKTEVLADG